MTESQAKTNILTQDEIKWDCHISYMSFVKENIIIPVLKKHNITVVTASFDGSGDSGAVVDVSFEFKDFIQDCNNEFLEEKVEYIHFVQKYDSEVKRYITEYNRNKLPFKDAIFALFYECLSVRPGWENNEGAYGDLTLDVEDNHLQLDFNQRITDVENYEFEF